MPLGFLIEFKTNINDYNKKVLKSNILILKKLLINIAGPLTNIIIVICAAILKLNINIIYANLIIVLINLIPIYPLDGGRIITNTLKLFIENRKAMKYTNTISNIFAIAITMISSITIYYYKNIAILLGLLFIWSLIISENKKYNTYSKMYKIIDKQAFYL